MPRAPEASIVFATHNRAARLDALLRSLTEQTVDPSRFEVVVVDDNSSDETPRVLREWEQRGTLALRTLRLEPGRGPAVARNAGWRAASAPLVVFTDDDIRATPEWLEAMLRALDGGRPVVVQGRTEPDPAELDREGPFSRTLRVRSLGPFFQTCNVAYPRALLERVDGFDEVTFTVPGGEDCDLAHRCFAAGATPVWAPEALAHHAVHQLGPIGKLKVAWRWSETMRLYARHPEMRRTLTYGLFWKKSHYLLVRALLALVVPKRLRVLRTWLYWPLFPAYIERGRVEGGHAAWGPYFLLHDAVELVAAARGGVRYRTPVL